MGQIWKKKTISISLWSIIRTILFWNHYNSKNTTTTTPTTAHGYMKVPAARNYVAYTQGLDWGRQDGKPLREYCPHCLNRNLGTCGLSESSSGSNSNSMDQHYNYDQWIDSMGRPIPFQSQANYTQGQIITIETILTVQHGGHFEVKACPIVVNVDDDLSNKNEDEETPPILPTQECFDTYPLQFVRDVLYDMPQDLVYPERGYEYGGPEQQQQYQQQQQSTTSTESNGIRRFVMEFQLPVQLVGSHVLLQWLYVTANSCTPQGYTDYFQGRSSNSSSNLPSISPTKKTSCPMYGAQYMPPLISSSTTTTTTMMIGEQFVNCAEVTIMAATTTIADSEIENDNDDEEEEETSLDNERNSSSAPSISRKRIDQSKENTIFYCVFFLFTHGMIGYIMGVLFLSTVV